MFRSIITIAAAVAVQATTLFTTNYDGTVSTLLLNHLPNGNYSFTKSSSIRACGQSPSWLTYDAQSSILYCSDEANYPNGTLNSFATSSNSLSPQISVKTIGSGVSSVEYGGSKGNSFIAIAHYAGSAVSTFALPLTSSSKASQVFIYALPRPGPNPSRQDAPHVHEVVLDPTGNFLLAPDLGSDLVHVFSINNTTGKLTTCTSYTAPPGSGPRHAAFKVLTGGETVMYLASELANNVTAIELGYPAQGSNGCLTFTPFQTTYNYAAPTKPPAGSKLAEIRVVEDNVYVTNRNTSTAMVDSLTTFALSPTNGTLAFKTLTSSAGSWPRTLAFNKNGTLAAVGNQDSGTVAIFSRDCSGTLSTKPVAVVQTGSTGYQDNTGLSSVIFAE